MIHKFSMNGVNVVMDVNSGAVHVVDDIIYDLADSFESMSEAEIINKFSDRYSEEEIKETSSKNPSGRLGELSDIVHTVSFLLSDKADYINGENINVNGGILLK